MLSRSGIRVGPMRLRPLPRTRPAAPVDRPPREEPDPDEAGERSQATEPLRARRPVAEGDVVLRGHDDHVVRRRTVRAVGAVRLPVRVPRRLHHHGHARARHVERDRVVVGADVGHTDVRKPFLALSARRRGAGALPRRRPFVDQGSVERRLVVEPRDADAVLPFVEMQALLVDAGLDQRSRHAR